MQCSKPECTRPAAKRRMCGSHYETWRVRQHAYGRPVGDRVAVDPVRRHVDSLREAGLSIERIAALADVAYTTVATLRRRQGADAMMNRPVAERLLAVNLPQHLGEVAASGDHVDATGMARRLQALIADGHSQRSLAEQLGMSSESVGRLLRGQLCKARTHRAVAAIFEELQLQPGASAPSRLRGERLGWALPLEWDEDTIDDPAAEPARARRGARTLTATDVNRREAQELAQSGTDTENIARELGVSTRTVERYLAVAS